MTTEGQSDRTSVEQVELGRFHRPQNVDGSSDLPGVVLVHDVWGLSDHSEALARDLAREGFGVLEIDLYRTLGELEIEDAGAHIRSLSDPDVLADLEQGAAWLTTASPACRDRRVGVMGVCMGGTFTLLAACTSERFAAAAPFYGILSYDEGMLAAPEGRDRARKPRSPIEAAGDLRVPTLASFGREDALVPDAHIDALEDALATSGEAFEVDRHADAGHAFLNHTRAEAYRASAAHAAWARVIPFLHAELD